jgi:tetratricopeptide (TPR) repeat protein
LRRQAAEAFSQARELVLQELRVNPRDASLYVELADHHAALGDLARARQALSDALQLGPQDAQTLFRIAVFYEIRMKRRDEALAWLRTAIERGQAWHEIDRAPELKSLRADPKFAALRTLKTSQ